MGIPHELHPSQLAGTNPMEKVTRRKQEGKQHQALASHLQDKRVPQNAHSLGGTPWWAAERITGYKETSWSSAWVSAHGQYTDQHQAETRGRVRGSPNPPAAEQPSQIRAKVLLAPHIHDPGKGPMYFPCTPLGNTQFAF